MKWLVTGGCGFIGTNVTNALLEKGDEALVLDNLTRVGSRQNMSWLRSRHGGEWGLFEVDVRDREAVAKTIRDVRPDVIAHLAGQVAMTTSLENPRLDFETNAVGTFNVLEAVRLYSPLTAMIYSSTNKVYGSLEHLRYEEAETRYMLPDHPNGLDETLALDGHTPYGCSKLAADQYVRDYQRVYGVRTIVFRHSSVYGDRQFSTIDQGWIGWFCLKTLETRDSGTAEFAICGSGKQVRDVLHVNDLIGAYTMAIAGGVQAVGNAYNIGGGMENSLSLVELFHDLEALTGRRIRFRSAASRVGDQKVFVADTRRAQRDFGWRPLVSKREGLVRMLNWTRSVL